MTLQDSKEKLKIQVQLSSIWHRKRLETERGTVYNNAKYCTGEDDKGYRDQSE